MGDIMEQNRILKSKEYLNEQTNKVIDFKTFLALNKNYKLTNKNDTLIKKLDRIILSLNNKKVTNDDLQIFDYLTNLFVIRKDDKQKITNINKLELKFKLVELYNKTKIFGVVKTIDNNNIVFDMGLKNPSSFKVFQSLYILLLKDVVTFKKPPKKEKSKKTIKK
jgi:hypothetical protein